MCRVGFEVCLEFDGVAGDDEGELFLLVVFEVAGEAEAVAQRGREEAGARRRPHHREGRQRKRDRRCTGPFADHDVHPEIFHRQVEHLLGRAGEAMDLVDEKDVVLLEGGKHGGQISGVLNRRAGGQAQRAVDLRGDDHRQRRLAQPRRARKQDVVRGLPPGHRRFEHER